ncbi:MAG: hypothetical protein K9L60_12815 [Methylovulum sp.]|jgi:hypothetical protein|nr:hypothetical protein [Methylovulum sp.]
MAVTTLTTYLCFESSPYNPKKPIARPLKSNIRGHSVITKMTAPIHYALEFVSAIKPSFRYNQALFLSPLFFQLPT